MSEVTLCTKWLIDIGIIPPNHILNKPDASVKDFAFTLRDGVALGKLLRRLKPSIPETLFNFHPKGSEFIIMRNIRAFLNIAQHDFKIPESHLFDIEDLAEFHNLEKVCHTLAQLSNTPESLALGVKGFKLSDVQKNDFHLQEDNDINEDEDIYGIAEPDDKALIHEEIYSSIIYKRLPRPEAETSTPADAAKRTQRERVIGELVETEKSYLDVLRALVEDFDRKLAGEILDSTREEIFKYIKPLVELHTAFYAELHPACTVGNGAAIAQAFIKWKLKFALYGDFCAHLPDAQALVDDIHQRDPHVAKCIIQCQEASSGNKFRLRDLLQVPFQRILKYHLLLESLLKRSRSDACDDHELDMLGKAHEAMIDVSLYVNEAKRDQEHRAQIADIQQSFTDLEMPADTSLVNYGRLQMNGESKMSSNMEPRKRDRFLFLFDKVLVISRTNKGRLGFMDALIMSSFRVDDVTLRAREKNWQYQINLSNTDQSLPGGANSNQAGHVYSFLFKTLELKKRWLAAFLLAKDNLRPAGYEAGGHKFSMVTFAEPSQCFVCAMLLRGTLYQGYECMHEPCHKRAHKTCLSRAPTCVTALPAAAQQRSRSFGHTRVSQQALPADGGSYIAIQAYDGHPEPRGETPLVFVVGQRIELIQKDPSNWWLGRTTDATNVTRQGVFPSSFVRPFPAVTYNQPVAASVQRQSTNITSPRDSRPVPTPRGSYDPANNNNNNNMTPVTGRISRFPSDRRPELPRANPGGGGFASPTDASLTSPWAGAVVESRDAVDEYISHSRLMQERQRASSQLTAMPWFAGMLARPDAEALLRGCPTGAFLVRQSTDPRRAGEFAISIWSCVTPMEFHTTRFDSYDEFVKHIKVEVDRSTGQMFISNDKFFSDIMALVAYYQEVSLGDKFQVNKNTGEKLGTTLKLPYQDVLRQSRNSASSMSAYVNGAMLVGGGAAQPATAGGGGDIVEVIYDYSPEIANCLTLRAGRRIEVLSRAAQQMGWWKGRFVDGDMATGYFPSDYVKPVARCPPPVIAGFANLNVYGGS